MTSRYAETYARWQADPEASPLLHPGPLDALWFQVTGTVCNMRYEHCFIACGPTNHAFGFSHVDLALHFRDFLLELPKCQRCVYRMHIYGNIKDLVHIDDRTEPPFRKEPWV